MFPGNKRTKTLQRRRRFTPPKLPKDRKIIFISSVQHECIFDKKLISRGAFPACGSRTTLNNPPHPSQQLVMSLPHVRVSTCTKPTETQPPGSDGGGGGGVKVGGFGWRQMHNRRQGKLSQRRRRGRAPPRASVTNQQLSGVDSAPWMSVIPQRPYAEQQHTYYGIHRRADAD